MSWLRFILSLALALAFQDSIAENLRYRVVDLPPLDDNFVPYYVNDQGHLVIYYSYEGHYVGYLFWSPDTGYQWVQAPKGSMVSVNGFNNHDQVVGVVDGKSVIWTPKGADVLEPPEGYESMVLEAINDDGLAVGRVVDSDETPWSIHRSPKGKVVVHVDDGPSCAQRLSNNRKVVAVRGRVGLPYCPCGSEQAPAYLVNRGKRRPITVNDSDHPCTLEMNNAGQVIVYSPDDGLWSPKTGFEPIGLDGSTSVELAGVSDSGLVAGTADFFIPFVWQKETGSMRLRDLIDKPPANLRVFSVSRKGVLGGTTDRYPVVLMPEH